MAKNLIHNWIEYRGRNRHYAAPKFMEHQVVSDGYDIQVSWYRLGGYYLPSFPMMNVLVITPDGKVQILEGGFTVLPTGSYSVRYVDRRQHSTALPDVNEVTSDGFHIKLSINVTYQVATPLAILENADPVASLMQACSTAMRSVIRAHRHDELISERPDEQKIPDIQLANEVARHVASDRACRAFALINVNILHREGDPKVMALRQDRLVQERKSLTEQEGLMQQQKVAAQERILREIQTEKDVALSRLRTHFEANRAEILRQAELWKVDIETKRRLPQFQHDETLKSLDVVQKVIESLIQAQSQVGFPRNADDLQLVEKILVGFPEMRSTLYSIPAEGGDQADQSNSTLVQLMVPKK